MDRDEQPHGWQAGDPAAFSTLVREHGPAVFGFVLRRVRDRPMAEDLAQEAFLRAWRSRASFRGAADGARSERGWLLAIAANAVRDHERMRRRRVEEVFADEEIVSRSHDPALRAEHAEALGRLGSALGVLPLQHREIFLLRERDGLSYKEIATVLGCPIGSVMSGLARARERLLAAVSE